jgi:hypothetical protein
MGGRLFVKNDTIISGNVILNTGVTYIIPNSSNATSNTWTSMGITWDSSASTSYSLSYSAFKVFDNAILGEGNTWAPVRTTYDTGTGAYIGGVNTTVNTSSGTTQTVFGEWLQIQSSTAFRMDNYTLSTGGTYQILPKSFFIIGSNDGTNWYAIQSAVIATTFPTTANYALIPTVISANSALTNSTYGLSTITTTTYSTYTTNSYIYFRLIVESIFSPSPGYGVVEIGEWSPSFTTGTVGNNQITLNVDNTATNQLNVSNNLNIGGKLIANSDASFNSRILVSSDVSLGGRLFVRDNTVFNSAPVMSGASITTGTIPTTALAGTFVDTSTTQTIAGTKTFSSLLTATGAVSINNTGNTTIPLTVGNATGTTSLGTTTVPFSRIQANTAYATGTAAANTTIPTVSIKTTGSFWSGGNIYVTSDNRIKTFITNITNDYALDTIRKIQPKSYNKIDDFNQNIPEYGFVAQDVKKLLPQSISYQKDYIPNIFGLATVTNNNQLELIDKTTRDLSGQEIKLKLIDYSDNDIFVTVDTIIDDTHFTIKESLSECNLSNNKIFVYGQEVDDFHILDKDTIFTLGIGAIKKLDEDLTIANKKLEVIPDLLNEIETQKQQIVNEIKLMREDMKSMKQEIELLKQK